MVINIRGVPPLFLIFVGCTTTSTETIKTGIFNDNPRLLLENFNKIKNGETTRARLVEMGFKLDAPNVATFVGVPAFQEIYGTDAFRSTEATKLASKKFLGEVNRFTLVKIPYLHLVTEEDRFYFSTKETITSGDDISLSVVFLDDQVVYHAPKHVKVNRKKSESAFADGFIKILNKYAGFGGNIRELVEELRKVMK